MSVNKSINKIPFAMTLNPDYGNGMYRRRVRLSHVADGSTRQVLAEMEDDNHGFRLIVSHDGESIRAVDSNALRLPMTTCADAGTVLQQLVGVPLSASPRALASHSNPRAHCTHQFDLISFAATHALRDQPVRQYDIAIHDERDGVLCVLGDIDGETVFRWNISGGCIRNEGIWQGVSVQKGFASWAENALPLDQLELALVIQRGLLVSTTRRVLIDPMAGMGLEDDPMPKGVCYSYGQSAIRDAVRLAGTARDFTHTPEQLLRFV